MSPIDYYTGEAKEKHERLTREHFDPLLKAYGVLNLVFSYQALKV
jgi:hypothetical protein